MVAQFCNILKTTLKGGILWHVNYIPIKNYQKRQKLTKPGSSLRVLLNDGYHPVGALCVVGLYMYILI